MNKHYRKLKRSVLFEAVSVTALAALVGEVILVYFIDGVYNDFFSNAFLYILESFGVEEREAINLYWLWIGDNKAFFMILGFLALFSLFFYIALSRMTTYLEQVERGIEMILEDDDVPIQLIKELKPIEEKLNEIKGTLRRQEQEAIEMEQKKNDMLLFLAHDLKTPLTSILAYLSMLESNPELSVEERVKYTQISLDKALRLQELILEFFDITKLNLQSMELEMTQIDLEMMLEQIADELYAVLKEHQLECEVETQGNLMISADPDKLARVFDNLLRNAIAYSYANTMLRITAREMTDQVEIVFENHGPHIEGENLQKIFEKFYRDDSARQSKTGGAGLGLAIAKEIVERHKGTIQATSEDEVNCFIIRLPLEKGEPDEVLTPGRRPSRRLSFGRRGIYKKARKRNLE